MDVLAGENTPGTDRFCTSSRWAVGNREHDRHLRVETLWLLHIRLGLTD